MACEHMRDHAVIMLAVRTKRAHLAGVCVCVSMQADFKNINIAHAFPWKARMHVVIIS